MHRDSDSSVSLDYGSKGLSLDISGLNATILRPQYVPGLVDEHAAFLKSVRHPYGTRSLKQLIDPSETVAIVIPDITRALPGERLYPWILQELDSIPNEQITFIIGTGTHRANTPDEIAVMAGPDIACRCNFVNHDARDANSLLFAGRSPYGYDVHYNAQYVQADRRILVGFVEPHFMAGFSGGYKAAFPGVADLNSILHYHSFSHIADANSTWGILEDNPTQGQVRAAGELVPVDFLINVTLNTDRGITGYFCGDVMKAHTAACRFSKDIAMAGVDAPFPIVVTTNSGYPLDLNLYQSVKGMTAAFAITKPGGLIITAARCNNGFPDHGAFKSQLLSGHSPDQAWDTIRNRSHCEPDQWQTQKLLQILRSCRMQLYSDLDCELVRQAHMEPITNMREAIYQELGKLGDPRTPVAILPEGPLTIPYLRARDAQSTDPAFAR